MAQCHIQSAVTLELNDIEWSVASYMGSLRYLKKLLPISVTNIIYNRINMKSSLFARRDVVGVQFMVFDPKAKSKIGSDMRNWTKGAADALEKKYLREFYLIFKDKITGNVPEHYKFSFTYNEESSCTTLPRESEEIISATKKILQNIENLSSFDKLPEDTEVVVEIIMMDTPAGYGPPSYGTTDNPLINDLLVTETYKYFKLGSANTGYHKMYLNLHGTQSTWMTNDNEQETDFESLVNDSYVDTDDELKTTKPPHEECSTDDNLSCHCGVYVLIKSIETITCSICAKVQHCPCVGYHDLIHIPDPYVCLSCNSEDHPAADQMLLKIPEFRKYISICSFYRFAAYYSETYKIVPEILLDNLAAERRDFMYRRLLSANVLLQDDDGVKVNFSGVRNVMERLFNKMKS